MIGEMSGDGGLCAWLRSTWVVVRVVGCDCDVVVVFSWV